MKTFFPAAIPLLLLSCRLFAASCHQVKLPELPPEWEAVLGSPLWRLEWFDPYGRRRDAVMTAGDALRVSLPEAPASPVLARPFWPEKGIAPGIFRPAGAVFPFDASAGILTLSWQGGIEASFFLDLAAAGTQGIRLPGYFNWPRFRRLFGDDAVNAEFRGDPWLADWPSIAERTVASGFDRRRLVPAAATPVEVPVNPGKWVGTSPFAPALTFETTPVFTARSDTEAETWVSAAGILRLTRLAWFWHGFCGG